MGRPAEDAIEKGLIALAIYNGDSKAASEALAAEGVEVDAATLTRWKSNRSKRFYELRNMRIAVVRDRMGEAAGRLADRRASLLNAVLDRLEGKLADLDVKDLIGLMRALDQGYGTSMAAMEKLTDQPSQVIEVHNYQHALQRLERLGVLTVDAEEIEPEEIEAATPT